MQAKTTRAFRTISEASEELDLQPHVLRFWESKFPQIKPIKRGGGRRFYRPDDIEFLRGIKTLLHDEKHPIKDVQKLIRIKGAGRISELGRSVEKAAREHNLSDMDFVPKRIKKTKLKSVQDHKLTARDGGGVDNTYSEHSGQGAAQNMSSPSDALSPAPTTSPQPEPRPQPDPQPQRGQLAKPTPQSLSEMDQKDLEAALVRLRALREQWSNFVSRGPKV